MLRSLSLGASLAWFVAMSWSCGASPAASPGSADQSSLNRGDSAEPTVTDDVDDVDDDDPVATTGARSIDRAGLLPSSGTGCAPGSRCILTSLNGRPQASGTAIAQCRGDFPDFIVPRNTIPSGYAGPWFTPRLIEEAHAGIPQGSRPWRDVDPRIERERLAYALTLRNYAFSSEQVRQLTPALTASSDYEDPNGRGVPAAQRSQMWYPAPRMMFGNPGTPGSGAREAAFGMTLERRVPVNELAGNTSAFRNYAVAYYDARGARTYARVWSTETAGVDSPRVQHMKITSGGLVFKLLFSAARPSDFPVDILDGTLALRIIPNGDGVPIEIRLLQIDIAVKDDRSTATGWYFATYAYDRTVSGRSPWRKMVPVGLTWGNDPKGPPLVESWINQSAPAYARSHLGVEGRLNGPVDNPASACMSCHSTAQAPSLANILPPASGPCVPLRSNWFRNLSGSTPFGRFDPAGGSCVTGLENITLTAADYSLQLSDTVSRAIEGPATFNPCTWDASAPPNAGDTPTERTSPIGLRTGRTPRVHPVTRDPE